jgi:hypothetical protein
MKTCGEVEVRFYAFLTWAMEGFSGQVQGSAANSRVKSRRYPLNRILCVPQRRDGHFEEGKSLPFARS